MKNTILLFFALALSVQFTNAQSDATKEETVQWLDIYGLTGNLERIEHERIGWFETMYKWDVYLNKEGITTFVFNQKFRDDENNNWVDNNRDTQTNSGTIMEISIVQIYPSDGGYRVSILVEKKFGGVNIFFNKKENAISLYKALKHLASFYDTNIEFYDMVSLKNKF